jgi:hypothetical protein
MSNNPPFPLLDLSTIELPTGEWAVVSADSDKPLTEEQASEIAVAYTALAELAAGK